MPGNTKVLGTSVPKPVQIATITSVWNEFPEIPRPERAAHITSVWDEPLDEDLIVSPQQGFPEPSSNRSKEEEEHWDASSEEEWFDAHETVMLEEESWENFPEMKVTFENVGEQLEPVLTPFEME